MLTQNNTQKSVYRVTKLYDSYVIMKNLMAIKLAIINDLSKRLLNFEGSFNMTIRCFIQR